MPQDPARAAAAAAAEKMIAPWTQACMKRDWKALLALCTQDPVFMPPGGAAVAGNDIQPWLDSFPDIKAMSWSIDQLDATGDLAYLRGPVNQTLVIDGKEQRFDGKYCDIMPRGSDGKWRFALVIWNMNSP